MRQEVLDEENGDKKKAEDESGGGGTVTREGGEEGVSLLLVKVVQEGWWCWGWRGRPRRRREGARTTNGDGQDERAERERAEWQQWVRQRMLGTRLRYGMSLRRLSCDGGLAIGPPSLPLRLQRGCGERSSRGFS